MQVVLLSLLACLAKPTAPTEPSVPPAESPNGTKAASHALSVLLDEHWEGTMRRWPMWASRLGDHRYGDKLPDTRPEAWKETRDGIPFWRDRVAAIDASELSESERITLEFFDSFLNDAEQQSVCMDEQWQVSPRSNAFGSLARLSEIADLSNPKSGDHLVERYRAVGDFVDGLIANLQLGIQAGRTPNAESLRRTIEMLDGELSKPKAEWRFLDAARADHPDWPKADVAIFRTALTRADAETVRPAFERYRAFLNDKLLPDARPLDQAGILHLPDGKACYEAAILHHTTLRKTADDLHQTGLDALASIHDEFRSLGNQMWGTSELDTIFKRLRTDKTLFFADGDAVVAKAESSLRRAEAAMGDFFGIVPEAPCVVTPIPDYEAPYSTIAYYRPPRPDGTVPGQYFINKHKPETRPIHEAEVLAFHESVPGHHLQLTIAQEQGELPEFRKHFRATAYTEGWALYTERLADEMGLYTGDLDRLGMLSFDAWRAARLVVDTGLHAYGWSREQAIDFMTKNTPLAPNNIQNEVDRYISWPGQALAYKTGQIEIMRLREEAKAALGSEFDLKAWHDAVLGIGAVPLPVLEAHLKRWLDLQAK